METKKSDVEEAMERLEGLVPKGAATKESETTIRVKWLTRTSLLSVVELLTVREEVLPYFVAKRCSPVFGKWVEETCLNNTYLSNFGALDIVLQSTNMQDNEKASYIFNRLVKPLQQAIKNHEELMQKRETYLAENNRIDKYGIKREYIRERWFTDNDGYFEIAFTGVGLRVVGFGKGEKGYYLELENTEYPDFIRCNEIPDSTFFQITRKRFKVLQKYEKPPYDGALVAMFGERPVYMIG